MMGISSNGRTSHSHCENLGSNPSISTTSSLFIDMTKINKSDIVDIITKCINEGMHWNHRLTKKDLEKIVHINNISGVSEEDKAKVGEQDQKTVYSYIMKRMPWLINYGYQSEVDRTWHAPFAEFFGKETIHEHWTEYFSSTTERVLSDFTHWIRFPTEQLKGAAKYNPHWIKRFKWARETLIKHPTFEKDLTELRNYLWDLNKRSAENPENQKNYPLYVSLYDSQEGYGGPEEGGWNYTHNTLLDSIKVNSYKEVRKATAVLIKRMYDLVQGAENPRIILEKEEGGEQTKGKPSYS